MTRVEIHKRICDGLNELYAAKNADYGGAFQTLRNRFPQSTVMRLWDKLLRLEQLTKPGYEAQVKDESVTDTYRDLANYAIMELTEREYEKQNANQPEPQPDHRRFIWGLADDGSDGTPGTMNDIELEFNEDTGLYELSVETIYEFGDNTAMFEWLQNILGALWHYVINTEPDATYKLTWQDGLGYTPVITGKTMHECAEKLSFMVRSLMAEIRVNRVTSNVL